MVVGAAPGLSPCSNWTKAHELPVYTPKTPEVGTGLSCAQSEAVCAGGAQASVVHACRWLCGICVTTLAFWKNFLEYSVAFRVKLLRASGCF